MMMAAGVAIALASCADTESPAGSGSDDSLPILDVTGAGITSEEAVTRAAGTTTLTSGSIGVFLSNTDPADTDPPYTTVSNRKYAYGVPKWTTAKAIYLGGEEANVCAYYPYSEAQATTVVPLTTQGYTLANDLSYAPNLKVNGGPDKTIDGNVGRHVTFVLKRAYSRTKFEFTRKNYTGTGHITRVVLRKLPASATLDIATGSYSGETQADRTLTVDYTLPQPDLSTADKTVTPTEELLVAPGKIAETGAGDKNGLALVLTIDNKAMTTYIKPTVLNELKAGKYYTFKVNVNGTGIDIDKVELEDWEAKDLADAGDKPFETEPK